MGTKITHLMGLAMMLVTLVACQLGTSSATLVPTVQLVTVVSSETPISATQIPTQINVPTSTSVSQPVATAIDCQLQNDNWQRYTVQVGDTLGQIASRVNSTINELTQVNCIANINTIEVGQVLRVPQLPPPPSVPDEPTFLPTISHFPPSIDACMVFPIDGSAPVYQVGTSGQVANLFRGRFVRIADNAYILDTPELGGETWVSRSEANLQGADCPDETVEVDCLGVTVLNNGMTVSPATVINDNCVAVTTGTVTVTYTNAPDDFVEVVFWVMSETGNTDVIGVDTTPEDGASTDYVIHSSFSRGYVYAFVATEQQYDVDSGQLAMYLVND